MRVDLCLNPRQFSPAEIREMIPPMRDLMRGHGVRAAYLFGSAGPCIEHIFGYMDGLEVGVE